jgi:hypothetical protein
MSYSGQGHVQVADWGFVVGASEAPLVVPVANRTFERSVAMCAMTGRTCEHGYGPGRPRPADWSMGPDS